MKLYHGTNIDFYEIDIKRCNPNKDFGQGFYLTDIKEQAFLIDCLVERMSLKLSSDKGISVVEAMNLIYNSDQYELILDLGTGLYYQSADYNYLNLMEELSFKLKVES